MALNLPSKVVVGFQTYKIERLDRAEAVARCVDGDFNAYTGTIRVRVDGVTPDFAANTLLHEILHACWLAGDLGAASPEEKAITVLANQLLQVWRDNPKVVSFITKHAA
jgi:hypothetical protein